MTTPWEYQDPLDQVIGRLEGQVHALVAELRQKRQLLSSLKEKQRRKSTPPLPAAPALPDLRGIKLTVVGPSFRREDYRRALEAFGITLIFAAGEEKKSQIYRLCSKSHGIIHITAWGSHSANDLASRAADRKCIPLVRLHSMGMERFRETVLQMVPDLIAYRDLLAESKRTGGSA